MKPPTARPIRLRIGRTVRVRALPLAQRAVIVAPFARFAERPPTEPAAQARAVADLARTLAPYVSGASAAQLCDAFTLAPADMVRVLQALAPPDRAPRAPQQRRGNQR